MSDETRLEQAERHMRSLVRCRSTDGPLTDFLAEYHKRGAERDEALGLLRELADWADLAYRGVARPDGAEVIADALALVERASKGGQT